MNNYRSLRDGIHRQMPEVPAVYAVDYPWALNTGVQGVRLTFCCQTLKTLTCILASALLHKDVPQGFPQVMPVFSSKWNLNLLTHFDKHAFKNPEFFNMLQMMIWPKTFLRTSITNQPFRLFFKNKTENKTEQSTLFRPQLSRCLVRLPERASCGGTLPQTRKSRLLG